MTTSNQIARLILVFDADSGVVSLLLDVVKKAVGREDCALCTITYGPLGKRGAWKRCEADLGVPVVEMHRDQLPDAWGIARSALPCVLAERSGLTPSILLSRDTIEACGGDVGALEREIRQAMTR